MLAQYGYTAFSILGYLLGFYLYLSKARQSNRPLQEIFEIGAISLVASLFGAKIFHTLFEAEGHMLPNGEIARNFIELLSADPWHWTRLFSHGHVFFGGLLMASLAIAFALWAKKIERPLQYADYFAPGLALGLSIGRLGCFFAGCCYGRSTSLSWFSVSYSGGLEEMGPVLAVQLIESAFAFCYFVFLVCISNKKHRDGIVFFNFILAYSIFRFTIEFLRGDTDRGLWLHQALSTSQIISLLILLFLGCIYSIAFDRKVQAKLS